MSGLLNAAAADQVAAALRSADFTVSAISAATGGATDPTSLRATFDGETSPLATLVRLFLLGDDLSVDDVARAVPVEAAAPLLTQAGTTARAAYDVTPYGDESHDWFVVSDRVDRGPLRPDHVVGIGPASATLAQLTVRRRVGRALDLGTGSGVQALHLSAHADVVTATDVVPRALQLAATTFALSGVAVRGLLGDLTEPVQDEEFDLVVCNPPFVVGPQVRLRYRDSGAELDGMSRRAVRAAASVLADGGVAQLLVNWVHLDDEDWHDRVAGWVADLGADALVVQRDVSTPADYVATWRSDPAAGIDEAAAVEWLRWLRSHHVAGIGLGWVVLRRGSAPYRVAVEEHEAPVRQPVGAAIAGWLDRVAWLRATDDAALLATTLRVAPEVGLQVVEQVADDGWVETGRTLHGSDGLQWSVPTDAAVAGLVAACDGTRPLAVVAGIVQALTGADDAAICAAVRALVDRGILFSSPS